MSSRPTHAAAAPRPARTAGRAGARPPLLRPVCVAVCLLCAAPAGHALPTGAVLTNGQATVQLPAQGQMLIRQNTPKAGLDWTNFSIAAGEAVTVVQPDRSSVLLNRVLGSDPSLIYGALRSNGSVWLINPRGIVFGASSRVDVGGLVASTLAIDGDALAGGRLQLGAGSGGAGELRSEGQITATDGSVALVAPKLLHSGQITARRVGLAAASEVLVDVEGDGLVFFNVRNAALDTRLAVLGGVRADGGSADIRAAARAGFADTVLNLEGVVQARSIGVREGRIVIDGGARGITRVAGTLDVRSDSARGGQLLVQGEQVLLEGTARLDASGATGGGLIRVGGDFQGTNTEVRNAQAVNVRPGALLQANAGVRGEGGRVIVWADDTTTFDGRITATGGTAGGDGGFVETSGKRRLGVLQGSVDVRAPAGRGGQWLLDPADIVVADGGAAGVDDVDEFADPGATLTVSPDTLDGVGGNVTLQATNSITVNAALELGTPGAGLTLQANSRIDLNANVGTNNGDIAMTTGNGGLGQLPGTSVNAGNATITIDGGGGGVTLNGGLQTSNATGNAIAITNAAALLLGDVATGGATGEITLSFSGTGTQAAGSAITAGRLVKQGTGTLVLGNAGNTYAGGTLVSGGTLRLSGAAATAGSGDITLGARTFDLAEGASFDGTLTLADGATLTSSSGSGTLAAGTALSLGNNDVLNLSSAGGSLTIARVIADGASDTGEVRVAGGIVSLQAANSYGGGTVVDGATLRLSGAAASAGDGSLVLGASTLDLTDGASFTRALSASNGATLSSSTGNGTLSNAAALTLADGSTLKLAGGAASTLTVERVIAAVAGGGAEAVNVTGGSVRLTAANSYTGSTTIDAGALLIAGSGATGTVGTGNITLSPGATLRIDRSGSVTLAQDIAGATAGDGTLEHVGTATTTLTGSNSYGVTVVANGVLRVGSGGATGTLGTGSVSLASPGVLRTDRSGTLALPGVFSGDGSLQLAGSGVTALTADSSAGYTGMLTLSGGTLRVSGASANVGTGALILGSHTLDISGGASVANSLSSGTGASVISSSGGGTLAAGTLTLADGATLNLAGTASSTLSVARLIADVAGGGAEAVNITGGRVRLTAANSYTGGTQLSGGGTLQIDGAAAAAGTGTLAVGGNQLDLTNGASVANVVTLADGATLGSSSGDGTLLANATPLTLADGGSTTLSSGNGGVLAINRGITDAAGNGSLAIAGGTVTLGADNSYDGSTTLADGSTLGVGNGGATGTAGSGAFNLGAGSVLRIDRDNTAPLTLSGALGGAGSLALSGGGTLVLTAANSHSGGTSITAGTLRVSGASATAGTGTLALGANTLDLVNGASVDAPLTVDSGARITSSSGGGTLAAGTALNLGNGAGLELSSSGGTLTVARAITDAAANATLTLAGGTVVLQGASSHGGGTTVNAGTLRIDGPTATAGLAAVALGLGANTLDITNGATVANPLILSDGARITSSSGGGTLAAGTALNLGNAAGLTLAGSGSSTLTVARAITDAAANATLTLAGGTVVLQGANSHGGGTTVNAGTLRIDGATATAGLATGGITLGANTLDIAGGATVTNPLTVAAGATVTSSSGTGTLAGTGTLTLPDAGTLNLSSSGASLTVARDIADSNDNAAVAILFGTVQLQGNSSFGGGIDVASGTLQVSGAGATPGDGAIRLGANTLDISGGSRVANVLTVAAGATLTSSSGGGTLAASAAPLTLPAGATLNLSSAGGTLGVDRVIDEAASSGSLAIQAGTVVLRADNAYSGRTAIGSATLVVGDGGASGRPGSGDIDIASGGVLRFEQGAAQTLQIDNLLTGDGSLQLAGGHTTLTAANRYTGGTTVYAGSLRLAGSGAVAGSGSIDLGANTLDLVGGASLANALTVANGATLTSSSGGGTLAAGTALNLGNAAVLQLSSAGGGSLAVARTLTDSGNDGSVDVTGGTVLLQAANSYGGGTQVSGTLRITGAAASAGSGSITLSGATLDIADGASVGNAVQLTGISTLGNSSGSGTLAFNATALSLADGSTLNLTSSGDGLLVARAIADGTGTGAVNAAGGLFTLSAAGSYDGGTTVGAGATLRLSNDSAAGTGAITLAAADSVLDITGGTRIANVLQVAASGATLASSSGSGTLGAGTLTLADGHLLRLSGSGGGLTVERGIGDGAGTAALAISGLVTLTAASSYGGGTTVSAGTLRIAGAMASAGSGPVALGNRTLDIAGGASVANALSVADGATLTSSSGGGTLAAGPNLSLDSGAGLTLSSAGGGTLTVARGVVDSSGAGRLTAGAGTVVLTADNSYGGLTTIASGATLALGSGGATGMVGGGAISNEGRLQVVRDNSATVTLGGALSGSGRLEQLGTGTTVLAANNSYGETQVAAGVLQVGGDDGTRGTLGTGSVTIDAAGILRFSRSDTIAPAVAIGGAGRVDLTRGLTEFTAGNSYSGGTRLLGGSLRLRGSGASAGTGLIEVGAHALDISDGASVANAISVADGATLGNSSGTGTVAANALPLAPATGGTLSLSSSGSGLFVDRALDDGAGALALTVAGSGGGSVTLGTANFHDGGTQVQSGTLALAADGALPASGSVVVDGGTLAMGGSSSSVAAVSLRAGAITGAGGVLASASDFDLRSGSVGAVLGGSAGLVKTGTGTVTLTGSHTYRGATTVNAGTLALGAGDVLPDGTALRVDGGSLDLLGHDERVASLSLLAGAVAGTGTLSADRYALAGGTVGANLGTGTLTSTGNSTLAGSAAAGVVNVDAGSLTLAGANRLDAAALLAVAPGATLVLNGDQGVGSLTLAGTLAGSARTLQAASTTLLAGALVNANLGAGTLTVKGSSTLQGTAASAVVQVDAGNFTLAAPDRLADAAALSVATGATLTLTGDDTVDSLTLAGGTLAGTGRLQASTYGLGTGANTAAGADLGSGTLTVTGNSTLAGSAGAATVNVDAGTLVLGAADRLADAALVSVAGGATLALGGNDTVGRLALTGTLAGTGTLTAASTALLAGAATGVTANLGGGTLTVLGSGTLAGSTAAARVDIHSGTLTLAGAHRLADTAAVTVAPGAGLALNGDDSVGSLALAGSLDGLGHTLSAGTGAITLQAGATVSANLGLGTLNVAGNATLAGTAASDTVNVDAGTFTLTGTGRLSAAPAVQLDIGGTLVMGGDQVFGTLSGGGALALGGYTLATGSGGDSTFAGVIGGSGGLVKQGSSSVFTLTGANTYTGRTQVAAGTLRLGSGLAAGSPGAASGSLATSAFQVDGLLELARVDDIGLPQPVSGSGGVRQTGSGRLLFSGHNKAYTGDTTVARGELATAGADELPDTSAVVVDAAGRLVLGGSETLRSLAADGPVTLAGDLAASGDLLLRGTVTTGGPLQLSGQRIEAVNAGNRFGGALSVDARGAVTLAAGQDGGVARGLVLGSVRVAAGGRIEAGRLTLGDTAVDGGTLQLVATSAPGALEPDAVLAGKRAVALPMAWADDAVLAEAGSRIDVAAGAGLDIVASGGGSVRLLDAGNGFAGRLSVLSGVPDTPWSVNATPLAFGGGAAQNYALQSRVQIHGLTVKVGGAGIVADVVTIRADRLATVGSGAAIVARLPYDSAAGTGSQLPGLTLELTPEAYKLSFPFGAPGAEAGLRVNVGSRAYGTRALALDAGYVTVLPRDGARGSTAVLLLGPTVNPAGGYRFFFDGAGRQSEIPVFYNGVLPTTPQVENSLSAAVAVSESARKERFDEAVRTENVAVRLRAGVIAEVGPAPSATQGTEGLRVPATCTPLGSTLGCAPSP